MEPQITTPVSRIWSVRVVTSNPALFKGRGVPIPALTAD